MGGYRKTFEILDHTADLGIEVTGDNLQDLFQNAAHAMLKIMLERLPEKGGKDRDISISGADLPDLLVRWLGEILYLFDGEQTLVTDTKIHSVTPDRLDAQLKIVPFCSTRHEVATEIKAVTYHQIEVTQDAGEWRARIIFDL
jgi:SHS2 domain-containing protein